MANEKAMFEEGVIDKGFTALLIIQTRLLEFLTHPGYQKVSEELKHQVNDLMISVHRAVKIYLAMSKVIDIVGCPMHQESEDEDSVHRYYGTEFLNDIVNDCYTKQSNINHPIFYTRIKFKK